MKVIVLHTDVTHDYYYEGYSSWRRTEFASIADATDFASKKIGGFYTYFAFMDNGALTVMRVGLHIAKVAIDDLSSDVSDHFRYAFNLPIA